MRRPIFIILLFSLLLFACRSQGNGPAVSGDITTITLAAPAGFQAAYERLIEQFQEDHPRIQVQFVPLSGQKAGLSLREQAALADIVLLEGQPPTTDAAAAFLDLTPLMAADPTFDAADFWPGVMDACRAAGVQVGLPFRANASLIFFDKDAFDAAGLPHPEPGWNWKDFQQAAQALAVSEGEQTSRYGFADGGNPLGLLAPLVDNIIRQSGDTLDGRRLAAELAWYVTLANDNVILSESGSLPHERQAAMWVSSQFGLTAARTALGDDLGVVAFPTTAGVSGQSNPVSAGCALISAGTSHSQAAWTFANYLSQQALFATGVYPAAPARPSVAQSSQYWEQMEATTAPAVRAALEQGWYRRAEMPELVTVGEALTHAIAGETALVNSLPGTVEIQPTVPPPPPDPAVAVATPQVTPTSDPNVIIVEYHPRGSADQQEATIALAESFNESQDRIHVNVITQFSRTEGFFNLFDLAEDYDCFLWGGYADAFANFYGDQFTDTFYSLSPLMDAEDAAFRDDFIPFYLERNTVDGELYAWPVSVLPQVIEYNVSLLDDLGLDPPTPDWTAEDFWTLAQAASNSEGQVPVYGFVMYDLWPDELLRFVPGATHFIDPDAWPPTPQFDHPAVIGALTWLGQMAEAGVLYPSVNYSSRTTPNEGAQLLQDQGELINRDQAAMWGRTVGSVDGVAPYPQTELINISGQAAIPQVLLISKRSLNPAGCWEWLKFLTAQPDIFFGVPVRRSVLESPEWTAAVGAEAATAYQIMVAQPRLSIPPWAIHPYRFWWSDALEAVFAGEDAAVVLRQIQQKAELFYNCYINLNEPEPEREQVRACVLQVDPDFQR
jgi:ABC-type glycerol-3-phosphate transport system substrate-binding protein